MKNNYIFQAWLVLTLALIFGGALAAVDNTLSPVIEANKINETLEKIPELILGTGQTAKMDVTPMTVEVDKAGKTVYYKVFDAKLDGVTKGYVAKSAGQGYADKIELLVGFTPDMESITGVFILEQKETPGLGNKIIEDAWRGQYANKKTTPPLVVVKGGVKNDNEIDSVTGATISSVSVTNIVNSVIKDLKKPLTEKKG